MHDVRTGLERDAGEVQAKFLADAQVHLVVHQPQRHLGDLGGELLDLNAVELVYVHANQAVHVHAFLARVAAQLVAGAKHLQLQRAQLSVADDQEVAAATGGVEKGELAQLFVKLEQLVAVAFDLVEFGVQIVQKQRLDELKDVFFAGVVGAQVAAGLGIHDALEQAAENGGADGRPVQSAGVEQRVAHGGSEVGHGQRLFKQFAVDVGELGQLLVQRLAAPRLGRVEHLKELGQARAEVGRVGGGAFFNEGTEGLRGLKDAGVVGEQAEQHAHQQNFERVAFIAAGAQGVVQLAHALCGLDVDRVLRLDFLRLVARDETEKANVLVQVFEREFKRLTRFKPVHAKAAEVADDDDLRKVALGQAGKVVQRLLKGAVQVLAA